VQNTQVRKGRRRGRRKGQKPTHPPEEEERERERERKSRQERARGKPAIRTREWTSSRRKGERRSFMNEKSKKIRERHA